MNILLTGYTGNLGPCIAEQLAAHEISVLVRNSRHAVFGPNIRAVRGDLFGVPPTLTEKIDVVIHAAACTAFTANREALFLTNVEGTRALLHWAEACPRLRKFVHISTTCVAGNRGGILPIGPLVSRPEFTNAYEESKWEAEQIVLASPLPVEVVRVATAVGRSSDGSVPAAGAVHHMLHWLYRGLIPMLPGLPDSRLDIVPLEYAASRIASAALAESAPGRFHHASSGTAAPLVSELLVQCADQFRPKHPGWSSGAIQPPEIVRGDVYRRFEHSVRASGDLLLGRICDLSRSFLPALLHPFTVETESGNQTQPWRTLLSKVIEFLHQTQWRTAHHV